MERAKDLNMNFFILYCKGWYESKDRNDVWMDLNKICNLDGYGAGMECKRSWNELLSIIMDHYETINGLCRERGKGFWKESRLLNDIGRNMEMFHYSYQKSVAMAVIDFFNGLVTKKIIELEPPVYSAKLTKYGFVYPEKKEGMTYGEQNSDVIKIWYGKEKNEEH